MTMLETKAVATLRQDVAANKRDMLTMVAMMKAADIRLAEAFEVIAEQSKKIDDMRAEIEMMYVETARVRNKGKREISEHITERIEKLGLPAKKFRPTLVAAVRTYAGGVSSLHDIPAIMVASVHAFIDKWALTPEEIAERLGDEAEVTLVITPKRWQPTKGNGNKRKK